MWTSTVQYANRSLTPNKSLRHLLLSAVRNCILVFFLLSFVHIFNLIFSLRENCSGSHPGPEVGLSLRESLHPRGHDRLHGVRQMSQDQKSIRGCVQVRKKSPRVKPVFTVHLVHVKATVFLYVFLRLVLKMTVISPLIWDVYPVNVCGTFHCRPSMSNAQLHLAVFSLTVTLLQKTFIQIVRYQQISVHWQRSFISRINLRS